MFLMFKWFRTIFSLVVLTYYSPATAINEIPDSLVYVRLNIEFVVAGKQKRNHRQLFFFPQQHSSLLK